MTHLDRSAGPPRQSWLALAALSLGFFMSLLDQTVIAVALPEITEAFGAELGQSVWVSSAYLLAVVVPLLTTGRLGDRYGHRRMFQIGIVTFVVAAAACAFAPTIEVLIVLRVVQGLGSSLLMPQTMAVINRVFSRAHRGRALGVWGVVGSLAGLTGPLLGGLVVGAFGWRGVFLMHLPVGLLALLLSALWVPRLPTSAPRVDLASVAASFLAVGSTVFVIQQGPRLGWPLWLWAVAAIGVGAAAVFVAIQVRASRRGSDALVPVALFRDRNYVVGVVSISAMGFVAAAMMIPMMMWLQEVVGLSAQAAGLAVAPMAFISMLLGPVVGVLADRFHPRPLSQIGFGIMIAAFLFLWAALRAEAPVWVFSGGMALVGVGQTFIWATNSAAAMRDLPAAHMGAASGVYNTTRQLGSVLGVAGIGAAMDVGVQADGLASGLANSLLLLVAALVVGGITVSFFRASASPAAEGPAPGSEAERAGKG